MLQEIFRFLEENYPEMVTNPAPFTSVPGIVLSRKKHSPIYR